MSLATDVAADGEDGGPARRARPRPEPLAARLSAAERARHEEFVATLGETPLWAAYSRPE